MKDIKALTRRFERIARQLPDALLRGDGSDDAFTREVLADFSHGPEERLLGFYAREGLETALEAYGIYDALRARGYSAFRVELDLQPFQHIMRVFGDDLVVCECRLRRARGAADPCIAAFQLDFTPELLFVEWLSLQDPRAEFGPGRRKLPGQDVPGSGVADEVMLLLYLCAKRLGLHGILEVPLHFHNAAVYRHRTHFVDPAFDGQFAALLGLLADTGLSTLAWAMERGEVVDDATGETVRWAPREQLVALDPRLAAYFESPSWRRAQSSAQRRCRPRIVQAPHNN